MNRSLKVALFSSLAVCLCRPVAALSPTETGARPAWMEDPMSRYISVAGLRLLRSDGKDLERIRRSAARPASLLARGAGKPSVRLAPRPNRFPFFAGDMRVNEIGFDLAQMVDNPGSPATTQSETNISAFGPNIVIGFNDSATLYGNNPSLAGYATSNDGGQTWHDGGGLPTAPNTVHLGDPGMAVNRAGQFYYATVMQDFTNPGRYGRGRATIGVAKSTDGGRTFSPPVDIYIASPPVDSVPGPNNETTTALTDKELIAVDNSGGSRDGTIYVAWNQYADTQFPTGLRRVSSQIMMVKSSDGGATWSDLIPISPAHIYNAVGPYATGSFVSGAVLVVGPGGEVYCAWEDAPTSTPTAVEKIARSDDGGATWALRDVPAASLNSVGNPTNGTVAGGVRVNEFPDLAVDRRNGTLYLVYNGAPTPWPGDIRKPGGTDRSDVYIVRSSDKGQTWSAPKRVNDDATQVDQFFPAVSVNASGVVGVMWYDRRNDMYNQAFDVYMAQSRDGVTFTANQRVTSVTSPLPQMAPNADPNIADNYMGDYIDMTSDGAQFYMAWGDNREVINSSNNGPRPDPNVYFEAVGVRNEAGLPGR